ncbi:hypothetical protein EYZ11_006412 [Aspergillus tanneri]|uniref:Uncharacterized protein n=1 Tax=Aspergillus tanneri TaxID=1220188 RepID=A0A4S3JFL4_9EURO|nr:hypothetical protein EYZ11_006412 [Aspergillus tanneri]
MVAYVACATVAYTLWWHKPKDMISPMTIFLPYDRHVEDMPDFVRVILESRPKNWASLTNILLQEESTLEDLQLSEPSSTTDEDEETLPVTWDVLSDAFIAVPALLYCGIHLATWHFIFLTKAEQLSWQPDPNHLQSYVLFICVFAYMAARVGP